ncbi:MAG: penicillin acylase family protein [Alphaproteobacteria bacterium]|nr:penicillin acylase family protein [Alphaproteobacteria bacterium]
MSKWTTRAAKVTGYSVAVVALLIAGAVTWYRASLPSYDGAVAVGGISAPLQIYRDKHAIPHVIARSYTDALFGLGYAEAQDRLWQMMFLRRVMQGRLAESIGPQGVQTDEFIRTLGLYHLAEQSVRHLRPDTRRSLEAYAAGINAYLKHRKGPLPIEFALLNVSPEPWRPADSIATFKYMQLSLSENMYEEIERARLAGHISRRQIEELYPPYPGDADNPLPGYISLFAKAKTAGFEVPETTASNNWVVSGSRSVTGAPLLANDPHLPLTIPSIWYLAHISYPGQDVVGAALPGVPGIMLGQNRRTAWGATNAGPDTQDIYIEKLSPGDPGSYLTPTGTARFQSHSETIKVRFGSPRIITIRSTRHGPVLPSSWPRTNGLLPAGYVLALAWTALVPDDTTIQANMDISAVKDSDETASAVRDFISPMQNLVHADADGHIGLMLASRVPIRDEQNDSLGLVPEEGWESRYDWRGYIPVDQLPSMVDPATGQIATANNKTVPENYPYTLTREWADPFRFSRISELLSATPKHSIESFKAIQLDIHDRYAEELVPLLLKAAPWPTPKARSAASMLSHWDFNMDANRPEPLIYEAWQRALVRRLISDELGSSFRAHWTHNAVFTLRILRNTEGEGRWCDDIRTVAVETCATEIRLALVDALTELGNDYGSDMARWRWGRAHHAIFAHQPFDQIPLLKDIFDREVETSGGAFTIRRGDFRYSDERPYAATHGSGYRAIYDLAHPDNSIFVITTGESGNVFSHYYTDMIALWAGGEYVRIPTDRGEINKASKYLLTLYPGSESDP